MARNNKGLNKYGSYFDLQRKAKQRKESARDLEQGLKLTKESILDVFEYLHPAQEVVVNSNIMTVSGDSYLRKNEVKKAYDYNKTITPVVQQLYENNFFNIVSGKYETATDTMIKTIEYNLTKNPIKLNQRGSSNENLAGLQNKFEQVEKIKAATKNGESASFFVYDTETIGGMDTNGIWRPMGITEFSMHQIDGNGNATGLGRMDVVLGLREHDKTGKRITKAEDLPIIKQIEEAVRNGNIAANEELRVTASRLSLYGDNRTKLISNADGSFRVGKFIDTEEGDMTDLVRIKRGAQRLIDAGIKSDEKAINGVPIDVYNFMNAMSTSQKYVKQNLGMFIDQNGSIFDMPVINSNANKYLEMYPQLKNMFDGHFSKGFSFAPDMNNHFDFLGVLQNFQDLYGSKELYGDLIANIKGGGLNKQENILKSFFNKLELPAHVASSDVEALGHFITGDSDILKERTGYSNLIDFLQSKISSKVTPDTGIELVPGKHLLKARKINTGSFQGKGLLNFAIDNNTGDVFTAGNIMIKNGIAEKKNYHVGAGFNENAFYTIKSIKQVNADSEYIKMANVVSPQNATNQMYAVTLDRAVNEVGKHSRFDNYSQVLLFNSETELHAGLANYFNISAEILDNGEFNILNMDDFDIREFDVIKGHFVASDVRANHSKTHTQIVNEAIDFQNQKTITSRTDGYFNRGDGYGKVKKSLGIQRNAREVLNRNLSTNELVTVMSGNVAKGNMAMTIEQAQAIKANFVKTVANKKGEYTQAAVENYSAYMDVINANSEYYNKIINIVENSSTFKNVTKDLKNIEDAQYNDIVKTLFDKADRYAREHLASNMYDHEGRIKKSILGNEALQADMSYFKGLYEIDLSAMPGAVNTSYYDITKASPENLLRIDLNKPKNQGFDLLKGIRTALHGDRDIRAKDIDELNVKDFRKFADFILKDKDIVNGLSKGLIEELKGIAYDEADYNPVSTADSFIKELRNIKSKKPFAGIISTDMQMRTLTSHSGFVNALNSKDFLGELDEILPSYLDSLKIRQLNGSKERAAEFVNDFLLGHYIPSTNPTHITHKTVVKEMKDYLTDLVHSIDITGATIGVDDNNGNILVKKSNGQSNVLKLPKIRQYEDTDTWYIQMDKMNIKLENTVDFGLSKAGNRVTVGHSTTFGDIVNSMGSATNRSARAYEKALPGNAEKEALLKVEQLTSGINKKIRNLSTINSFNGNDLNSNRTVGYSSIVNILPELFGKGGKLNYLTNNQKFLDSKLQELLEKDLERYMKPGTKLENLDANMIKDLEKNLYELLPILAENAGVEGNPDIMELLTNVSFTANEKQSSGLKGVMGGMQLYSPQSATDNTQRPTILASGNAIPMRMENALKLQEQSTGVIAGNMISNAMTDKSTLHSLNGVGMTTTDVMLDVAYLDTNALEIINKNHFAKVMDKNNVDSNTVEQMDKMFKRMSRINTYEQERHMDGRIFEGLHGLIPAQIENVSASKDFVNATKEMTTAEAQKQLNDVIGVRGSIVVNEKGEYEYKSAIGKHVKRGDSVLKIKGYGDKLETITPKMQEGIFIHRFQKQNGMTLTDDEITKIINENKHLFVNTDSNIDRSVILEKLLDTKYNAQGRYRIESTTAMGLVKPMSSSAEKGMTNLNFVQTGSMDKNVKQFFKTLGYESNVKGRVVTGDAIKLYMHDAGIDKVNKALEAAGFKDVNEMLKAVDKERNMFNEFLFGGMLKSKAHIIVNDGVLKHENSGQVQFGMLQKSIDNIIKKHGGNVEKAYKEVVDIINETDKDGNKKYQFLTRRNLRTTEAAVGTEFIVKDGRIQMPDMGTSLDDLSVTEIDKLKNLIVRLDEAREGHGEKVVHTSGYIQKWNKKTKQMEFEEITEKNPVLGAWQKEMIGDKEVLVAPITKESMKLLPDVETESGSEYRYFELQKQSLELKKEIKASGDKGEKDALMKRVNAIDEELRNYESISKRMKITNLEYQLLDRIGITDDYLNLLDSHLADKTVHESTLVEGILKGKIERGKDGNLKIVDENLKKPALDSWLKRHKGLLAYKPNEELQLLAGDVVKGAEYEHLAEVYKNADAHGYKLGVESAEKIYKSDMAKAAYEFNNGKTSIEYLKNKGFQVKHVDDINFEVDDLATQHMIIDLGKDFDYQYRYIASPGLGYKLNQDDEVLTNGQKELNGLARMYDNWKQVRNLEGESENYKLKMQEKALNAKKEIKNSIYGKNAYMDSINYVYADDVNYRLKASGAVTSSFAKGLNQTDIEIDNDLLSGSFIDGKSLAQHHKEGRHYDYKFVSLETMRNKGMFTKEMMEGYGIDVNKIGIDEAEEQMIGLLKKHGTMDITGRYPNNMIDSLTATHVFLDETLVSNQTKVSGVSGLKMLLDHDGDSVSSFSLNYTAADGRKIDYGMFVNNREAVKQMSEEAYNEFSRLEATTTFKAETENHKWLKDVEDVIVKDAIRNSNMANLGSTAFVPGGNSILGNISPAAISRIDRMVDLDETENIVREAVEKSNEFLANKDFASKVSLINKSADDLSNAEFFDNTLSVLKTAQSEGLIDSEYLTKAENAVVSKLLTEKAATATLSKTGVATTGGINVATNAIKQAGYDVLGHSKPMEIDMLKTALYVPEQAAISYKKVKTAFDDTKGRDITEILTNMFPSHYNGGSASVVANIEDFNNWYQTHAGDKLLDIYEQFKGRISKDTVNFIGDNKDLQKSFVLKTVGGTLNELGGNEVFQAQRLNYRSRHAAGEVIGHSGEDTFGSVTARIRGEYDHRFNASHKEAQEIMKESSQVKAHAQMSYAQANTQTAKSMGGAVMDFITKADVGSVKVGSGLGMAALGLAGGLMAAGYASGNPLNDKQASQVAQEGQQPVQTMSIPDFMDKQGGYVTGNTQQGYIINIKADTKKGRKHMQRIMKQAAEASVGGAVSVNMNIRNNGDRGITDADIENFLDRHL